MGKLATVGKSLWSPDGEVPLYERGVIPINRRELTMLSLLHEFAAKHQISVVCKRCNSAIQGKNSGQEQSPAVSCQCREFRYTGG